jgi:tetratricopeptide (TPR) repeat protein
VTSERWQQIERLFAIAKDCAGASRASLLDRECGRDPDLRREVEELLDAASLPGQLDRLAVQVAPAIGQLRRETVGWEGRTVGHYQILEPCGSGGMGVIYKALDQRLGRHVALKFLSPHLIVRADAARRLLREARAAAALDHPNICTIHDVGESEHGHPFIAMPLYAGETLEARLRRGPVSRAEALALIRQLALALEHAHQRGIVHRDIKPANVMVLPDDTLKVLDFGVARCDDTTATDAHATPGTLAYMSPEQLQGEATDHRADLWSTGVVLYEMVTGGRPFRGDNRAEVRRAILTGDPEPLAARRPDLPPALDALLQWVLAKPLEARCPSAGALRATLDELLATNGASEAVRIPERVSQTRVDAAVLTPYAGRDEELATLESQWAQACAGQGRVTVVIGEAGAGKSRLLQELRARVASRGTVRVLQGRCGPPDTWSGDAGEMAARLLAIDPAPTLLLLEDWQWADTASREILRRLAEMAGAHALLIVVTCRPEAGDMTECGQDAIRLPLAPLGRVPAAAIMRALLGVERLSEALAQRIYARTGGNALFLEQVCHALRDAQLITVRDGEAIAVADPMTTWPLPDTVLAVIRARLDRLDRQAIEVLQAAAVIGPEFEPRLLAEVLDPHLDLASTCAHLHTSGLIQQTATRPEPAYGFRHVLTQQVAYDSLPAPQRQSLHTRVGQALERDRPDGNDDGAERLAHHFSHAGRWDDAVRHGLRAGARAARLSRFADALAIFDRVRAWMRHLPETEALADLLLEQERLSETLGLRSRQHALIEELIASLAPRGPSARLIRTYVRHGDLAMRLTRFGEAERALETARRLSRELGESMLEGHALRSLGLLRAREGRHTEALQIAEEALAIDRDAGDERAVAGDLATIGAILRSTGEYAWALARLDEAMALPALREDPAQELFVLHTIADVYRTQGDLDAALRSLLRADEIAVANLLLVPRSSHLLVIAQLHLQQGRLDDALRTWRETVALCRQMQHAGGLAQALWAVGEVLFVLNRDDEALPCLQEAAGMFAQIEDRRAEADLCGRLAIIFERRGSLEAAAAAYERLAPLRRAMGDAAGELEAVDGLARLTRQRHATSPLEALPAYAAALDLATAIGDRRQQAALHNTMGILAWQAGRYGDALRHYDAALDRVRELGDRTHEGLMLNSVGVTLHRLGRPDEARTVLEKSVTVNRTTGERLFEAHALTVLGDISAAVNSAANGADTAIACFERSRLLREALGDEAGARAMRTRLVRLRISQPASAV